MDNKESAIIRPDHVFDFDLLMPIFPDAVRVGDRLIRLGVIKGLGYEEIGGDEPNTYERVFIVSYTAGEPDILDDDEQRELEAGIKAIVQRAKEQEARAKQEQQEMMTAATQEAYRRELQQVRVPNIKTGLRPEGFKR